MAGARGVEIRVADTLPSLTVDVGPLEFAFVNLLSNAIKYSDPDKAERYVEVSGAVTNGTAHIEVRDNGIGIPEAALPRIFERPRNGLSAFPVVRPWIHANAFQSFRNRQNRSSDPAGDATRSK